MEKILNDPLIYFELDEYVDERLENEIRRCRMTLKDAFEIEDVRGNGTVTVQEFEEILKSMDLEFDQGKLTQ